MFLVQLSLNRLLVLFQGLVEPRVRRVEREHEVCYLIERIHVVLQIVELPRRASYDILFCYSNETFEFKLRYTIFIFKQKFDDKLR